jgi:hypothetical protein
MATLFRGYEIISRECFAICCRILDNNYSSSGTPTRNIPPATGNAWAVKCFTRGSSRVRDRYRQISGPVMTVDDDLSGRDFSGKWLVVYNTSPADFYAGSSSFSIAGNTAGSITCTAAIDRDSPGSRYYVCDSAVKVSRNGDGLIYYSGYDPGGVEDHGQFLCRRVQSVSFALQPGTLATEPTVSIALKLALDSLSLTLERQVRLVNFP